MDYNLLFSHHRSLLGWLMVATSPFSASWHRLVCHAMNDHSRAKTEGENCPLVHYFIATFLLFSMVNLSRTDRLKCFEYRTTRIVNMTFYFENGQGGNPIGAVK
ncbi:hypothetical protein [Persicobacter psychrovividus]|uniref:hypothetical protein n=1 Tax=Persicobacter psychrovividus TaxID=387638 RepID=UPI0030CA4232